MILYLRLKRKGREYDNFPTSVFYLSLRQPNALASLFPSESRHPQQPRQIFINDKRHACARKDANKVCSETTVESSNAFAIPCSFDSCGDIGV